MVVATYLPRSSRRGEVFLLAVYPPDRLSAREPFILDGNAPESMRRLSRGELSENLRRSFPRWFTIYRVIFPAESRKKMVLAIRDLDGMQKRIFFYKGPKYLITQPKF